MISEDPPFFFIEDRLDKKVLLHVIPQDRFGLFNPGDILNQCGFEVVEDRGFDQEFLDGGGLGREEYPAYVLKNFPLEPVRKISCEKITCRFILDPAYDL